MSSGGPGGSPALPEARSQKGPPTFVRIKKQTHRASGWSSVFCPPAYRPFAARTLPHSTGSVSVEP
jgi:hypothetical protein